MLKHMLVRLAMILLMSVQLMPAGASASSEDASCTRHDLDVALVPADPTSYRVAGWLCATAPYVGQTVILASPPGLATHAYWDWPVDKDTYSFVRHATRAGFAVFNYDRIGTGESDRPAAVLVSVQTEAYLQHQLVERLRGGDIGGVAFGNVALAGNSLSTLINIFQAEAYDDVDGLINTGIVVGPSPIGLAELFMAFYPAQADPKFAGRDDIPLGYATTQPGSRDQFFHLPAADPATVALDEALKDTATAGEAVTFGTWYPLTRLVRVPVLSVIGDHDGLACLTVCESGGPEETKEQLFWSSATCFEMQIVPSAGHFLQLQPNSAAAFEGIGLDWLTRRVGLDTAQVATHPCAA